MVILTADPLAPGIPSVPGFPCTQHKTQQVSVPLSFLNIFILLPFQLGQIFRAITRTHILLSVTSDDLITYRGSGGSR